MATSQNVTKQQLEEYHRALKQAERRLRSRAWFNGGWHTDVGFYGDIADRMLLQHLRAVT